MRFAQKLIKCFALVLAFCLILTIFATVVGGASLLGALVSGDASSVFHSKNAEWTKTEYAVVDIQKLELDVGATSVKIRSSDQDEPIRVETNNQHISSWMDGDRLKLVEKSHGIFDWGEAGELLIYLKEDVELEDVDITLGAGTLEIESLTARELKLELGAGKTTIEQLNVTRNAKIEGGAGLLEINEGVINNAKIEVGAGRAVLQLYLSGHNRIETGVGKLDLDLLGSEKDYRINIEKGLGSVEVNGHSMGDDSSFGSGNTVVNIESGVGAVEIKIVDDKINRDKI